MGIPVHVVDIIDGANGFARSDRVYMGLMAVPYGAGGSAGAAVTVVLTGLTGLPATAAFFPDTGADVTVYTTGLPATGINVVIEPRLAASTIAAGSVNILIVA